MTNLVEKAAEMWERVSLVHTVELIRRAEKEQSQQLTVLLAHTTLRREEGGNKITNNVRMHQAKKHNQ